MRYLSNLAVLVAAAAVSSCQDPASSPAPSDHEITDSLIFSTTQLCVPIVFGEQNDAALTRRSDISKSSETVHGVNVTRYIVAQPGKPSVTIIYRDGKSEGCWISASGFSRERRFKIADMFSQNMQFNRQYSTTAHRIEPTDTPVIDGERDVACVFGKSAALIWITEPRSPPTSLPGGGFLADDVIEVHVDSSPIILRTGGCIG